MTTLLLADARQIALEAALSGRRLPGYSALVATAEAWQGLLGALREAGLDIDYTTDEQQQFAGVPAHVAYSERELDATVERLVGLGLRVLIVRGEDD